MACARAAILLLFLGISSMFCGYFLGVDSVGAIEESGGR